MVIRSVIEQKDSTLPLPPTCVLDEGIVNADTLHKMTDIGLSFFAELCGRNRGVFVLNPSNGNTYGCTEFPTNFATLAGVHLSNDKKHTVTLKDANSIKDAYNAGNITASDTVALLDYMIKMVYYSSGSDNVKQDLYGCSVAGLAKLQCPLVNTIPTIRSVTLVGLFHVPAPWATGGKLSLTEKEAHSFYTAQDFKDMHAMGLNTVQIPVSLDIFSTTSSNAVYPKSGALILNHVSDLLDMIQDAHLQAILVLVGSDNDEAVAAAAKYATKNGSVVFGLTLPSIQSLGAARAVAMDLKLFIPVNQGSIKNVMIPMGDVNVFASMDFSHSTSVADIASSSAEMDRMKLFYHEAISCQLRSPLEFSECYQHVPVFVSTGFDLSIDDCHLKDISNYKFIDYGQCNHFQETITSAWWHKHRQSLAARQLFAYEQGGMGWSFAAWKLFDNDNVDVIDSPAKLLALKHVVAAGLFPTLLTTTTNKDDNDYSLACLNPPVADFTLGDDTVAPSPGPPPDCGNGWWNASIQDCSYWIPPPPTDAPTPCPIVPEPMECPNVTTTTTTFADIGSAGGTSFNTTQLGMAAGAGALVAIIVGSIVNKFLNRRSSAGYSEIPSHH